MVLSCAYYKDNIALQYYEVFIRNADTLSAVKCIQFIENSISATLQLKADVSPFSENPISHKQNIAS